MRSTARNTAVAIWRATETPDPVYNTPIYTNVLWKDDVFAKATPRRGREVAVEGQVVAEIYMKFDFEFFDVDGIDESYFIMHEGNAYDIKGLLPDLDLKEFYSVDTVRRAIPTQRA